METTKLKLMAAVALCLAYSAGIATGWAGYTLAGEEPRPPREKGSWISQTLDLDEEQKEKMEEIWSREAQGHENNERSQLRALYDERDRNIRAILTEEQAAAFDEIHRECDAKREEIHEERRRERERAIAQTMAILNPEQQEKYQKIIEGFERRGSKRERGGRDWRSGTREPAQKPPTDAP